MTVLRPIHASAAAAAAAATAPSVAKNIDWDVDRMHARGLSPKIRRFQFRSLKTAPQSSSWKHFNVRDTNTCLGTSDRIIKRAIHWNVSLITI